MLLPVLLLVLIATAGCRTDEEKMLEQTLALYAEAYSVLEDRVDKPNEGIAALQKFEEDSRDRRATLKTEMKAAKEKLSEDERKAFEAEAEKRYAPFRAKFAAITKRYPDERRKYLKDIIDMIVRLR